MAEEQPEFKVVDRRPFNPDGTRRELSVEEQAELDLAAKADAAPEAAATATPATPSEPEMSSPASARTTPKRSAASGDPLDDPASFLSLIMSLASNAAASMGMMPHPVTGETKVDLRTAKHWIDVLGMLEKKTSGNLEQPEA